MKFREDRGIIFSFIHLIALIAINENKKIESSADPCGVQLGHNQAAAMK